MLILNNRQCGFFFAMGKVFRTLVCLIGLFCPNSYDTILTLYVYLYICTRHVLLQLMVFSKR